MALCALLVVVAVPFLHKPAPGELARELDRRFLLPDHTITSDELDTASGAGWLNLQYQDTLSRLSDLDWKNGWPIRWPRFSLAAAAIVVLLGAALIYRTQSYIAPVPVLAGKPAPKKSVEQAEEIFKDWEKAAEITKDPELRKMLADLKPLRQQLPKMSEREMLAAMSKLENTLQALRDEAAKNSLQDSAADMAAALQNIDGQDATAAALRRNDFGKAAELAEKAAGQLAKPGALLPKGAENAANQQQMEQAAQKLSDSGNDDAASGMNQMAQSGAKNDPQGMGKGMQKLSNSFSRESSRQQAQSRLGTQLSQIGRMKSNMTGDGDPQDGQGGGMSQSPSLAKQNPGQGAGSDTDPNRTKAAMDSDAARAIQSLTGMKGEGESTVQNLRSNTPGNEAPREGTEAEFAKYEKLSQQAITDESLPLAYREAIRKYFETIRPTKEQ